MCGQPFILFVGCVFLSRDWLLPVSKAVFTHSCFTSVLHILALHLANCTAHCWLPFSCLSLQLCLSQKHLDDFITFLGFLDGNGQKKWTFFPFSRTANSLIATFVKNREKVRCQGIVSLILLTSSKKLSTHRTSDVLLLLENGKCFIMILSYYY